MKGTADGKLTCVQQVQLHNLRLARLEWTKEKENFNELAQIRYRRKISTFWVPRYSNVDVGLEGRLSRKMRDKENYLTKINAGLEAWMATPCQTIS
jgi:hypothetical protein